MGENKFRWLVSRRKRDDDERENLDKVDLKAKINKMNS